jgi:hypothetical protein
MSLAQILINSGGYTSAYQYVERVDSFPLRAVTGAGWSPFVFEKELVVSLRKYFEDPSIEIVEAWLDFSVSEEGGWLWWRYVTVYVNGVRVHHQEGTPPITGRVSIPVTYLSSVVQFRVEYGSPVWFEWLGNTTFEGVFSIRYRKYLERGETPEDVLDYLRRHLQKKPLKRHSKAKATKSGTLA